MATRGTGSLRREGGGVGAQRCGRLRGERVINRQISQLMASSTDKETEAREGAALREVTRRPGLLAWPGPACPLLSSDSASGQLRGDPWAGPGRDRRGGGASKYLCPEAGELQGLSAPQPLLSQARGWAGGRVHPQSACCTSPVTVAFCFLGDTRIRWCVQVTNLRAGQLYRIPALTRRGGEADTLGQCWKVRVRRQRAAGPQALSAGRSADPGSGRPGSGPAPAVASRVTQEPGPGLLKLVSSSL